MLWDLSTDYYLHHADPRLALGRKRRSYTKWWTPANLKPRSLPQPRELSIELAQRPYHYFDDYWLEYYRPRSISSFAKVFTYNLNSTMRYIPIKMTKEGKYDLSPFVVRNQPAPVEGAPTTNPERQTSKKKIKPRKGIIEFPGFKEKAEVEEDDRRKKTAALRGWLPNTDALMRLPSLQPSVSERSTSPVKGTFPEGQVGAGSGADGKISQVIERVLNPSISEKERSEYERYMSHPLQLPLVISSEPSPRDMQSELVRAIVKFVETPRSALGISEEDRQIYEDNVDVPENPLKVDVEDGEKKRYLAYGNWVRTGRLKRQGVRT